MLAYFCSLDTVKRGSWLLKASSFDDQILVCLYNEDTKKQHVRMFYSEERAYIFIEKTVNGK